MEIAKIIGLFCAGFGLLKTRLRREEAHSSSDSCSRTIHTLAFIGSQAV